MCTSNMKSSFSCNRKKKRGRERILVRSAMYLKLMLCYNIAMLLLFFVKSVNKINFFFCLGKWDSINPQKKIKQFIFVVINFNWWYRRWWCNILLVNTVITVRGWYLICRDVNVDVPRNFDSERKVGEQLSKSACQHNPIFSFTLLIKKKKKEKTRFNRGPWCFKNLMLSWKKKRNSNSYGESKRVGII